VYLRLEMKASMGSVVVFLLLAIAFFAWAGPPPLGDASYRTFRYFVRPWIYGSVLFLCGAGFACFARKGSSTFPPTAPQWLLGLPRWILIAFGILAMIAGIAWVHFFAQKQSPF
jgi:hypothetical protein